MRFSQLIESAFQPSELMKKQLTTNKNKPNLELRFNERRRRDINES
jgi:hypothetical protein